MASNGGHSDDAESLPPSCKYVLRALTDADGSLMRDELVDELCHRERTISGALKTLENCGYIVRTRKNDDLRQVVVKLADERSYNPPESDRSR